MKRIVSKIKAIIRKIYFSLFYRLKNEKITILSNNCLAGYIYQDFKIQYQSPTIAVQIPIFDFVRYVNSFNEYNKNELVESNSSFFAKDFSDVGGGKIDFPCAYLGDIKIMFQHEKDFSVAKAKWERRVKRITSRIVVVIWAEDSLINDDFLEQFNLIKYKKILLTRNPVRVPNSKTISIPEGKEWFSQKTFYKRYFEVFNWKKFLNS